MDYPEREAHLLETITKLMYSPLMDTMKKIWIEKLFLSQRYDYFKI